ncbi:sigma-70 family RNA polymerase sigma factor [Phytohabitans houttuyneae]|uniref:RNA polymerase sigma factor n=1 Tax=Phytohabitans houttuyneae TaxID=1076126 RepID=A0A6V8KJW9_9ACTN|nr:sigma-70 family RNA polymerase sigma factor [Phytohabitans houttuyneae]GFJ85492.1 RNA polymerase sigma factor [Phytohabitans houttuyneae]
MGEESAFAELVERHRRELRVHCYRMLGSYDEAEDLVQETFLRAWKGRDGFAGRSSLRAWLYRIATNACLDTLRGRGRRVLPQDLGPPSGPDADLPPRADIPWLQPFPDRAAPVEAEPDSVAVTRETMELAFLVAIQHLPPRQRATLILRDVLGWSAKEAASALDASVASTNSALQRARATLREHLPEHRLEWTHPLGPTEEELAVVRRYVEAVERADLDALADLMAEDIRAVMPPWPMWFAGRDTVLATLRASWDPALPYYIGRFRVVPVAANGMPAVASYVCAPGDDTYKAFAIGVLRVADGRIAEISAFHDTGLFAAFGLPDSL